MTQPFAEGFPGGDLRPHQETALDIFAKDQTAGEPITVQNDLGKASEAPHFEHVIVDENHHVSPDMLARQGLMGKTGHSDPGSYPQTEVKALADAFPPAQGQEQGSDIAAAPQSEGWTQDAVEVTLAPTPVPLSAMEQLLGRALRAEPQHLALPAEGYANLGPMTRSKLLGFIQQTEATQTGVSATPNLTTSGPGNIPEGYLSMQQMIQTLSITSAELLEALANSPFAGSIRVYPDESGQGAAVTGVPDEALPHIMGYIRDKQNQGDNN